MTPEQLAAIKIGDLVSLGDNAGKVAQTTKQWFMVTWAGGNVEIVHRRSSILTGRMQLVVPPKADDDGVETAPRHWQDGE